MIHSLIITTNFLSRSLRRVRRENVSPSDILRLMKQPRGDARQAVRSADYMAQTLRLLHDKVHHVHKRSLNATGQQISTQCTFYIISILNQVHLQLTSSLFIVFILISLTNLLWNVLVLRSCILLCFFIVSWRLSFDAHFRFFTSCCVKHFVTQLQLLNALAIEK